jgi:DNA processing protein
VISGGALGIDTAAHQGALEGGGPTVAVLGTGLGRPYPAPNRPLFAQIAAHGAVVTEHGDNVAVRGFSFLERNRLIAALAEAVVVVQAPARSGALSTAGFGFGLKRPVFAVPYPPWEPRGEGCLALLRRGANICTSIRDILSLPLRRGGKADLYLPGLEREAPCHEPLDEDCRVVMGALSRTRPTHPDELTIALGLHILKIRQALTQLQLRGLVIEVGPGMYAKGSGSKQR